MGRSPCCDKNGLKKGPWTPEEDHNLLEYIRNHGSGNWRTLPKNAGLQRCGKSCRLRWTNYLRPDIKRGKFSFQEEETIIHLHSILGNKWSAIACRLPGRTDNEIKNYWNTHIRKRLLRMGIDPVTHSPRLDLLDISSILNQSLYNHNFINPNSQVRMARLLGLQPMVNPEILKLASSMFSRPSQPDPSSDFTMQDHPSGQTHLNSGIENQAQFNTSQEQFVQPCSIPFSSSCDQARDMVPMKENFDSFQAYDNSINVGLDAQSLEAQSQGLGGSSFDNHLPNLLEWDMINQPNYVTCYDDTMFGCHDHSLMGSMFPRDSSLNSTTRDSSSNSTYITTEDERESYCSNLMKFELPADLFDVSEYL